MRITEFTEEHYKEFEGWKYPDKYSVYNVPEWDAIASRGVKGSIPRESHMSVLEDSGDLLGVCCFQNMGKYTYVGICLRPEMCDLGHGKNVLRMCIDKYHEDNPKKKLVAEIRRWNSRSLITFMKVGFKVEDIRSSIDNHAKPTRFVILTYSEK